MAHLTVIIKHSRANGTATHEARCSCGWLAPVERHSRKWAEDDATDHVVATGEG